MSKINLGIFLSSGESFLAMSKSGQDIRFKTFYVSAFAKNFAKVFIFSYANENVNNLPENVQVIPNKYNLHRFIYAFLMPFINYRYVLSCNVFRSYHLLGTMPAIITKLCFRKIFMFNYGYDYVEFAQIEKKWLQILLIKLLSPIACSFADKIMAVTKMVLVWTPQEKTFFIPNGVDIKVFKPYKKMQKSITSSTKSSRKLIILNVGRLETQKNQINLVKALKGLPVKLLIVGNGSLKLKIEQEARRNKVNLTIIPKVANTKLPEVYNRAEIFAQPSLTEGPTKVLLEAMACGVPVVGSNVHGISEVLKDNENGLLCGVTPESIRSSIVKLLSDQKLRQKLGRKARSDMVNGYNLDKLLEKEINLIKSLKND